MMSFEKLVKLFRPFSCTANMYIQCVPMYYRYNFGILSLQVIQNDKIFTAQCLVLKFAYLITYHQSEMELLNSAGRLHYDIKRYFFAKPPNTPPGYGWGFRPWRTWAQTISIVSGKVHIWIQFVRQRFNPTLETNKQNNSQLFMCPKFHHIFIECSEC